MKRLLALSLFLMVAALPMSRIVADHHESGPKPKHTIKQVMKEAHKKKLLNKVMDGKASKEEKQKLLDLYVSLWENKPPKGEQKSWDKLTSGIVVATAKSLVGREGAAAALKKATNCGGCHKPHKPPSK